MNKEFRNPLFAGVLNVVIPGAGHLYVSKDWIGFVGSFLTSLFLLAVLLSMGVIAQDAPRASLPQGVCMGILLTFFVVGLFVNGYNVARKNNNSFPVVM